jgi:asparagine synthase (glutamine-hydrolysing)
MCGIGGIVVWPERSLGDMHERLAAMARVMAHRGPDDQGIQISADDRVGLVNRRLAIRDRTPAGHMPMSNGDGSVWITYNGEIYNAESLRTELEGENYRFHSHSDTEVILHGYEAWGLDVVSRLRGMFAFAILDTRQPSGERSPSELPGRPRLLLARDQMGIKPLYYTWTPDAFAFASEVKGLLASGLVGKEIDAGGLCGYLLMGSVPNPLTIYEDVAALPPASFLCISPDFPQNRQPTTYWRLPVDSVEPSEPIGAVESIRALLAESVRIRLVSDVPLGAFLSGGLDSSSVVALMRQATGGPIRTCSMVFDEAGYSEAFYARTVAGSVESDHFERVVRAQDVAEEFDQILRAMDQPSVDGVNTYFVSQTARQAGLTVALSGLGGDELFGGYPNTFGQVPQVLRGLRAARLVPGGAAMTRAALGLMPRRHRWSNLRDGLARPASLASAYFARRGLFSPSDVQALVTPELWQEGRQTFDPVQHIAERAEGVSERQGHDPHSFEWVSRAELGTYTHDQLLRDTDVMSMAHSLEVRVPLLDVDLVEAMLRLPTTAKTNGPGPKPLLSQVMADRLPPVVLRRNDKKGFTFPMEPWLRGPLQPQALAALDAVQAQGWLQAGAARHVFHRYRDRQVHWSRFWALVALASIL